MHPLQGHHMVELEGNCLCGEVVTVRSSSCDLEEAIRALVIRCALGVQRVTMNPEKLIAGSCECKQNKIRQQSNSFSSTGSEYMEQDGKSRRERQGSCLT